MLKISGEAFAGDRGAGGGIDFGFIDRLVDELKTVATLDVQLGLVVGGGNIVRGTAASEQGMDRVSADYMGMLATVINALALQDSLEKKGVDTRVMTAIRMEELAEPYIRRRCCAPSKSRPRCSSRRRTWTASTRQIPRGSRRPSSFRS